jgi:hypothetical protein
MFRRIKIVIASIVLTGAVVLMQMYWRRSGTGREVHNGSVRLHTGDHAPFQNGDIIFQTSRSGQSKAIQLASGSKYSHMGIIYEDAGALFVYEAVQPVKMTTLDRWIDRGEGAHYVVKRLKDSKRLLTPENIKRLKSTGEKFKGKDYDIYFEWSDDRIYCSELVWKMYKEALDIEIGKLQALQTFDLSNDVVKSKMKERYGDKIPMDEEVISPVAMFDSDLLFTVEDR